LGNEVLDAFLLAQRALAQRALAQRALAQRALAQRALALEPWRALLVKRKGPYKGPIFSSSLRSK